MHIQNVLSSSRVPRFIFSQIQDKKILEVDRHGFCDASQQAYAAVIYVRIRYDDVEVSVNILFC